MLNCFWFRQCLIVFVVVSPTHGYMTFYSITKVNISMMYMSALTAIADSGGQMSYLPTLNWRSWRNRDCELSDCELKLSDCELKPSNQVVNFDVSAIFLYCLLVEVTLFHFFSLICRHWFRFLTQKLHLLQRLLLMEEAFPGDFGFIVWLQAMSIFSGSYPIHVNLVCAGISWSCEIPSRIIYHWSC